MLLFLNFPQRFCCSEFTCLYLKAISSIFSCAYWPNFQEGALPTLQQHSTYQWGPQMCCMTLALIPEQAGSWVQGCSPLHQLQQPEVSSPSPIILNVLRGILRKNFKILLFIFKSHLETGPAYAVWGWKALLLLTTHFRVGMQGQGSVWAQGWCSSDHVLTMMLRGPFYSHSATLPVFLHSGTVTAGREASSLVSGVLPGLILEIWPPQGSFSGNFLQ